MILYKKFRNLIFRIISRIGNPLHFNISSRVDKDDVLKLISKIKPKNTFKELIRIGPNGDGGYLLPDDFVGIKACFSPGVDQESRFEFQLAELGMKIFMADYSISAPFQNHPNFNFQKKYLASYDKSNFISLDTWVNNSLPNDSTSDLLLQMDIEGAEFECVFSVSNQLLNRFRIIVIEIHDFDQLFERNYFKMVSKFFGKLLANHSVVHLHPNNYYKPKIVEGIPLYTFLEITFVRNDRINEEKIELSFPNKYDFDNVNKESIVLDPIYYKA